MNQPPDPARRGTYEALFKVAAHELEEQTPALHQIPHKEGSRDSFGHDKRNNINFFNDLQWLTGPFNCCYSL